MYQGSFPPKSNRAGWSEIIEVVDDDTDEFVDLSDAEIVFEVRNQRSMTTELSATIDNEKIEVLDTGVFQVSFTAAEMRNLCAGTYDVGCTISNADSEPQQFIIGTVAVLDGVVT